MKKHDLLTWILASGGTLLLWFPILAPVFFGVVRLAQGRRFLLDYLMPGELFPVVLVGGGALLWAAVRARSRRGLIGWSLLAAVVMLFGALALAQVTGLASGEIETAGWPWALTLGMILLYALLVMVAGVGGILLIRDLFRGSRLAAGG